jgi:hypothetical protein
MTVLKMEREREREYELKIRNILSSLLKIT